MPVLTTQISLCYLNSGEYENDEEVYAFAISKWDGHLLAWPLVIHTFHTLGSRYLCQLTPLLLLRCILMRSVPDSQWKVFSSSQELREWMLVCGAASIRKR